MKGKKTCVGCGAEFNLREETCPGCGAEYCAVFNVGNGNVLIHDKPGEEIAVGIETYGGYALRMNGRPATYHRDYKSILREIRHSRINVKASEIKTVEDLIRIEEEANDFIKGLADKEKDIK